MGPFTLEELTTLTKPTKNETFLAIKIEILQEIAINFSFDFHSRNIEDDFIFRIFLCGFGNTYKNCLTHEMIF